MDTPIDTEVILLRYSKISPINFACCTHEMITQLICAYFPNCDVDIINKYQYKDNISPADLLNHLLNDSIDDAIKYLRVS